MKNLLLGIAMMIAFLGFELTLSSNPQRTVTGIILAETNEPLIYANVTTKDSKIKTTSDLNGRFSIGVPDDCAFLVVSYIGYTTQEVYIKGKDSVTVILKAGLELSETIVSDYKVPLLKQDANHAVHSTASPGYQQMQNHATGTLDGIRINSAAPNTEDYSLITENMFHSPQDAPLSTFSVDVDKASYANVRRFLTNSQRPPIDAVRIEEMVNYFDYEYPQPQGTSPIAIITETGTCPWNPQHKLVHIGLQGKRVPVDELPASNLVFLLDVSGSMNTPNKLPLVIESFKILTTQLRQKDRVAIVVYAGSSGLVLPSIDGSRKAEIYAALENLRAGGSTGGAAGIRQAYQVAREHFIKGGNNRVILATDGDFNVGVSSDAELVGIIEKERESGVFLSVVGFGMGNYKDNKMQQLADHGNGNHSYVDNISEARKVFIHEFGGTLFTIAKDVKIQVEFNPSLVAGYRLIGYENRLLQNEDFNDDLKDAGEIGSGHTVTALYEIIPAGVKSDFLKSVDKLKYQLSGIQDEKSKSGELMTIKFRYKEPDGATSKLIEKVVLNNKGSNEGTSENFRWSAAIASFGMLLRESKFAGTSTYDDVRLLAGSAIGKDVNGYRKEFLELVNGVEKMMNETAGR